MNFRLIESKVTHLHIFPLRTYPDCLCWMGRTWREAVQKSFSCIQLSKAFYFHSDPGIPGANPMYLNVRTYSMKGFRIISWPQQLRLAWLEDPHRLAHHTVCIQMWKACLFSITNEMPRACVHVCMCVCVCECVFKRAYMCKNIAFVCVFSIKHAHAFIMAKDVSLCVCMCSNGPVCVHSSIAKKEVCVCACMFEGVCVCI